MHGTMDKRDQFVPSNAGHQRIVIYTQFKIEIIIYLFIAWLTISLLNCEKWFYFAHYFNANIPY